MAGAAVSTRSLMNSLPERTVLPCRKLSLLVLSLFVSAAYLYAFPQANLIYPAVVLLHAFGGVLAILFLLPWLLRNFRQQSWAARLAWLVLLAGGVPGLILLKIGTRHSHYQWLNWHMGVSVLAGALLLNVWASRQGWLATGVLRAVAPGTASLVLVGGSWTLGELTPPSAVGQPGPEPQCRQAHYDHAPED